MNEVTQLLSALEQGDPHAASRLLPLVYEELRKLAAQRMAQEQRGRTLRATALVHHAYICSSDRETLGGGVRAIALARRPGPCGVYSSRLHTANADTATVVTTRPETVLAVCGTHLDLARIVSAPQATEKLGSLADYRVLEILGRGGVRRLRVREPASPSQSQLFACSQWHKERKKHENKDHSPND
jgi:hypothetical protein